MYAYTKPKVLKIRIFNFKLIILAMSILKQIGQYLYLVKKDPNQKNTEWMKYMHGINRISILLFLFAMVVLVIRMLKN
jgi:hypothetical protein